MLGLPALPRKLPSRNWLIFWTVSSSLAAAIIYDRREKRRATARWAAAVAPLAQEPLADASAMPRRVTVVLAAPPGDGLRAAQEHFKEYVKPVLASSGLDWEFVVGRRQGDVRAAVAERIRRARRKVEQDFGAVAAEEGAAPAPEDDAVETVRRRNGIAEYAGVKGDIVVGRHAWKEYVRGLHEGWLGPLTAPAVVDEAKKAEEEKKDENTENLDTPKRPPQPPPYNSVDDYPSSPLPRFVPAELGPSAAVRFPHLLGFFNTPTRLWRFLHRRAVADEIGREVAAVCFAAAVRPYAEGFSSGVTDDNGGWEQQTVLAFEEKDWVKTVWKDDEDKADKKADKKADTENSPMDHARSQSVAGRPEKTWRLPVVVDPRIGSRMQRFELPAATEAAARQYVVPEEAVEGWTKGKLRQLARWTWRSWTGPDRPAVHIGNLDSDD